MNILGISAFFHDSAAAIISDGRIACALQEERFSRIKHDSKFPVLAIKNALKTTGISAGEIDAIVFYDKPLLKFERLLETYMAYVPKGFASFRKAMPVWLREKLFLRDLIYRELKKAGFDTVSQENILFSEHHLSHAASAFYPSPYAEAAILTIDGVGEWATTSIAYGNGNKIDILQEIHFPHSLGLLYSAFTAYCGFKVNSGEYKLMGLAPYGKPVYTPLIRQHLVDILEDGSYQLNMEYFDYAAGLRMTNNKFDALFGAASRTTDSELTQFYKDIAASIQEVTEEIVEKQAKHAMLITGSNNLCLAGGVALNCVANGKLLQKHIARNIWVQPASGDAGGALGAALALYYGKGAERNIFETDGMQGAYLGNAYENQEIAHALRQNEAVFHEYSDAEIASVTAAALADGKAVGWFQGRMEFGPRALGNRSVLADPRLPEMQKTLNLKIKFRESFRPFAPVVLKETAQSWFDLQEESPYMMFTVAVKNGKEMEGKKTLPLPAITHVDGSARVQTTDGKYNPKLYTLLREFEKITGCPVLVNTSFNVRGEPIVNTPEEAYHCFMATDLDVLVIENYFLLKEEQPQKTKRQPKIGED